MSFRYGDFIEVLHIADHPGDRTKLQALLGLDTALPSPAALRLFQLVLGSPCRTVVVEKEYIDLDFRKGFARFHYQRHFDTPRRCIRLHFFASKLRREHLARMPERVKSSYLGFTVLRPLPAYRIGRSILSESLVPTLGTSVPYITCQTCHEANLAGNTLHVRGVPYMEQDTLVLACATASIWMATWHMARRFAPEFKAFLTPEITDMCTRYAVTTGRAMPSTGLTSEQMLSGMREMGYDPLSFDAFQPNGSDAPHNFIYRFIESEIPVILSLIFPKIANNPRMGGHAATIVGHTLDMGSAPSILKVPLGTDSRALRYCTSSAFVPAYIAQDDSGGPFRYVEFLTADQLLHDNLVSEDDLRDLSRDWFFCLIDRGSPAQEIAVLRGIMVPLPSGVMLSGYVAEQRAIKLLAFWMTTSGSPPPQPQAVTVLRTFLRLSNELKESFNDLDTQLARLIRGHLLSRWVWVTELSDLESLQAQPSVLGQVVQDSAAHARSMFNDLISFNLPSHFVRTYPTGRMKVTALPSYATYPPRPRIQKCHH